MPKGNDQGVRRGDWGKITTPPANDNYRNNFDAIFGKKEPEPATKADEGKEGK